jgi:asparagine synthase (glutamine-hydrolysing)
MGSAVVNHFRGTFTAAVTDGEHLWAFRDHIGHTPLFYRDEPGRFFAAVEAKQVVAGAAIAREPDIEVLERIFYDRLDDDLPCALKGVCRLPKASIIEVEARRPPIIKRYWHPEALLESAKLSDDELRRRLEKLAMQAVTRVLTGEDVVGLSGGIDSSLVAAFAAPEHKRLTAQPLSALSVVFPSLASVDEREYIEMTARHLNLHLYTHRLAAQHLDNLRYWVKLFDGPAPRVAFSEVAEYDRQARQLGFRAILSGEMAEFVYDVPAHLIAYLLHHGRFGPLWRHLKARRSRGQSWAALGRELASSLLPSRLALAYARASGRDWRAYGPDWLDLKKLDEVPFRNDLLPSPGRRWSEEQLGVLRGPGLALEADDICAALCGVRVRRPLSDVDLWEFFLSLPAEQKYPRPQSKALIRDLLRGRIPDAILDRRDKTFFDDHVMSQIDYAGLRHWLIGHRFHITGVKYDVLQDRLTRENFTLRDYLWAKDLASIHAFLSLW